MFFKCHSKLNLCTLHLTSVATDINFPQNIKYIILKTKYMNYKCININKRVINRGPYRGIILPCLFPYGVPCDMAQEGAIGSCFDHPQQGHQPGQYNCPTISIITNCIFSNEHCICIWIGNPKPHLRPFRLAADICLFFVKPHAFL